MKADHAKAKRQLSIAKGQLEGIMRMVDEDAYCIDVSNQILATIALLKKLNVTILSAHLEACVASSKSEAEIKEKVKELEQTLSRMGD